MDAATHVLTHRFSDLASLKQAYMSFVRDGGIFIPSEDAFKLGDTVTATITLPINDQTFTFTSEVIWITPKIGGNTPGVGLQCNEDEGDAFHKAVKELLADFQDGMGESDTM